MILPDTNIWIDHIRKSDPLLVAGIESRNVLVHPYVIGEVGLGSFQNREEIVEQLGLLPSAVVASHSDVMRFIACNELAGTGIGYVDCHLLASALIDGRHVWTRDKRLARQAQRLGIMFEPPEPS